MKSLTWNDFKTKLELYPELQLNFVYEQNEKIYPNYHITEFKLATIESVDCGGKTDSWKEIILQVLEPKEKVDQESMSLGKIQSIFQKVSKSLSIPEDAVLRIEFGNANHVMRQYFVSKLQIEGSTLLMHLVDGQTECKASASCGLPKEEIPLNLTAELVKNPKLTTSSCCQPSSSQTEKTSVGCC